MNLVDELHGIVGALLRSGVEHAVCGGVAVTAYGATRSTRDIDLLAAPDDLPRALEAVRPLGYALAALPLVFDEGTEKERHVQRVSKIQNGEHLVPGFLVATASLAGFLENRVEVMLPEGREIPRSRHIAQRVNDAAQSEEGSPRLSSPLHPGGRPSARAPSVGRVGLATSTGGLPRALAIGLRRPIRSIEGFVLVTRSRHCRLRSVPEIGGGVIGSTERPVRK